MISKQPAATAINTGQSATFTASAKGCESPAYAWEHLKSGSSTWEKLSDGGGYSGTGTFKLVIADAAATMSGDQYRVVASNAAGTAQSSAATLTVTAPAPAPTPSTPAPSSGGGGGGGGVIDPRWLAMLLLIASARARLQKRVGR
jgi:hypothetical protein